MLTAGRFAAWWWVVVLFGLWSIVRTLDRMHLDDVVQVGTAYWMLLGFVVLGELRPIVATSRRDPDGVNLATAFLFAVLLYWGIELATVGVILATILGELVRRKPVHAIVFNVAQYSIAYLSAWGVLRLHGWSASVVEPAYLDPHDLFVLLLAGLTYHVVNLGLVGVAIALCEGRPLRTTVTDGFVYYSVTTGAVLALSPLVVVVLGSHWGFLPLLLLPLYLVWTTARMSLDREHRGLSDGLTGLANRVRLEDAVVARAEATTDPSTSAALCLLDLDRFKEVNDTLGHATGDQLLSAVAGRLSAACGEGDLVARLGGDEFALLVEVEDMRSATDLAARVAASVREPVDVGGVSLEVEVSIGVALFPDHGDDLESLLRRADLAMYEAKSSGEAVCAFRRDLDRETPARSRLLSDLRRGLDAGELELHYQPQVGLPDGELLGVEALVRWRHPTMGLLLPGAFLPLAESTATMRSVTAVVLELALRQSSRWNGLGLRVPIAVNVSLHDLADGGFSERVSTGLREHRIDPSQLQLEITEQALVSDPARVFVTLQQLRDLEVTLSLDDFGTGHASLTRLKRLPVGEVKIDRRFIMDLDGTDPQDAAIVRSVLDLAAALGLRSVAEGVETRGQWDALVGLGCDAVQGWYVAAPMTAEESTAWMQERLAGGREMSRPAARTRLG